MVEQFKEEIVRYGLCTADDRILLAVSGGIDSMVMLHLFLAAGFTVGVAHGNFQLRGHASQADELFVESACQKCHVPFYSKRFDTKNYAAEHGYSTQVAARKLRYDWFGHLCRTEGYHILATAHHRGDNLETLLLHLVRGTGWQGLTGIPMQSNNIIRPLLNFTRQQIEDYARANAMLWREDSSNAEEHYDRNFIRHQVIPRLKELNPSLEATFSKTISRLAGAGELITLQLAHLQSQHCVVSGEQMAISKALFAPVTHKAAILWELIKSFGFNYAQCEDAAKEMDGQPGKKFYSSTHQLTVDRQALIISKHPGAWEQVTIAEGQRMVQLGPLELQLDTVGQKLHDHDILTAHLDADAVRFPLTWRKWMAGDFFYPLGMEHRKKLSDFFTDIKISLADKNLATVIESQGQIVWVTGYRIDNRFKITQKTKQVLQLRLKSHFR